MMQNSHILQVYGFTLVPHKRNAIVAPKSFNRHKRGNEKKLQVMW